MRLGQSVTIPILLSSEFSPKFALWTAVAPICAIAALDLGYIKPRRRRERAEKLRELRRVHAEFIARQKKEAEEATSLLRESTARKTKQEQETNGLVIVEAVYGNVNAGLVADVTIAVQALVNNSQLVMPGGHSKVKRTPQKIMAISCFFFFFPSRSKNIGFRMNVVMLVR